MRRIQSDAPVSSAQKQRHGNDENERHQTGTAHRNRPERTENSNEPAQE
ncbi:MAG: hypothetical protein GY862_21475 [Gammaproteobacteria bacterium]|nr:hypothetical protein [Gammaproteobacteria bacterium]